MPIPATITATSTIAPTAAATIAPTAVATMASAAPPTAPPTTAPPTPAAADSGSIDIGNVLPTPTTTDVVLLVGTPDSLTAWEGQWLDDLRAQLGRVDALAYRDVAIDRLRAYFVVFVIDRSPDLDIGALAEAYRSGLTIHLIGAAAQYQDQVTASASP